MSEDGARELAAINEGIWSAGISERNSSFTHRPYSMPVSYRAIILTITITINELNHVFPGNTAGALGHARRVGVEAASAQQAVVERIVERGIGGVISKVFCDRARLT